MKPFFSFYGGKWLSARRYPMPKFKTLIEPFAGSAGYSVRHHTADVKLYDVDPVIVSVWDFLIKATACDIYRLPSKVIHIDDLPDAVPQEAKWLIGFWLNLGSAAPKKSMSSWESGRYGGSKLFWGEAVKDRLSVQVDYIKHWTVNHADFATLDINQYATWFVDPPYEFGGQHYRHKLTTARFVELGSWCKSLKGQVIVCEKTGATWLPFKDYYSGKALKYQNSKEAIWYREGESSDGI